MDEPEKTAPSTFSDTASAPDAPPEPPATAPTPGEIQLTEADLRRAAEELRAGDAPGGTATDLMPATTTATAQPPAVTAQPTTPPIPEQPPQPPEPAEADAHSNRWTFGIILVIVGVVLLLGQYIDINGGVLAGLLIIGIGVFLIFRRS